MEINSEHVCVFCTEPTDKLNKHHTCIMCTEDDANGIKAILTNQFTPAGNSVLFGQIIDGKATVSVNDDLTGDEIALLMSAFMDRISNFEHIKRDPSVIMKALMEGINS